MPTYEEKLAINQRTARILAEDTVRHLLYHLSESARNDLRHGMPFDIVMSTFAGAVVSMCLLREQGVANPGEYIRLTPEEYERSLTEGHVYIATSEDMAAEDKQARIDEAIQTARAVQSSQEINGLMAHLAEQIAGDGPLVVSFVDGVPQWVRAGEKLDA